METPRTSQEKLAAALAAIVFFIPMLMDVKTPFVVKYMKQGFIINVAEVILALISSIIWGFMGITSLLNFVCFLTSLYLAFQAFSGKEHVITILMENTEKVIQALGVQKWFTSK
jgi:ABC-type branched-subunit amino acid transport system permease subunit